jgi:formamidopyrimidine-DNA glycosylase
MPELPEVQTTVNGLNKHIIGLTIKDCWTNYGSSYFKGSLTIKDAGYFTKFKEEILGKKVVSVERRAKNILINLSGGITILVHMKMTGHLLFGSYKFNSKNTKDPWEPIEPEGLKDPFNRHVRFIINFNKGKSLALSDVRKFAKVTAISTEILHDSLHLNTIGPEPLKPEFTFDRFKARLELRPNGKIKQVLMDQSILAGIGNIYADESLWHAGIHPLEKVRDLPLTRLRQLYAAIRSTLSKGIDFGGDSMSDYRNVSGEKGKFQEKHHAYKKTGMKCDKPGCKGIITRISLGGRGTHFCSVHQVLIGASKEV